MKAIQITLDDALLARLDADEEVQRDGRSAVLRRAADEYLRRRRKRSIAESVRPWLRPCPRSARARELGARGRMARAVNRGEIWTYRFKAPDKRRPVLVLSRQEVIPLLHTVMVAPVTSTRRGLPSEVPRRHEGRLEDRLCRQSGSRADGRARQTRLVRWRARRCADAARVSRPRDRDGLCGLTLRTLCSPLVTLPIAWIGSLSAFSAGRARISLPAGTIFAAEVTSDNGTFAVGTVRELFKIAAVGSRSTFDVTSAGQRFLVNTRVTEPQRSAPTPITVAVNWASEQKNWCCRPRRTCPKWK